MQNKQKWNLKDTVYTEPVWSALNFCRAIHGDCSDQYNELKKAHEATLLEREYRLIAVLVRPLSGESARKELKRESNEWYATFEDAVDAVASRIHRKIVEDQDQLTGVIQTINYYRKAITVKE